MNKRTLFILTLATLCLGVSVSGRAAEPEALTVASAIAEAIQSNAELRVMMAHIETVSGSVRAASTYPFTPEAVYTEGLDRHIGLSQTLAWPGKRSLREAFARHDIEVAEVDAVGFKAALAAAVRTAFFELLAAREQAATAEDECQTARLAATTADQRVDQGFAPLSEALKARTELVNAERQRLAARQTIVLSGLRLNQLLGRANDAPPPMVTGTLAEMPSALPLATILDAAIARNPDLKMQALEIRKADTGITLARQERRPDIGVEAFFEQNSRDTGEQKAGFSITVPLPLRSANAAGVANARGIKSEAELALDKKRREVHTQVQRAYAVLTGARQDVALFSPELSHQLKTQSEAAREKYASGAITLLALVDIQQTRRNYQKDYLGALLAVHRAWSELELAAGVSLEELK